MSALVSSKRPLGISRFPSIVKLPDSSTPLKLALAWLVVCATPTSETGQQRSYYSSTFLASILDIVAREAFEVNPTAITFATLQRETDRLIKIETAAVARTIARRQERGQAIPEDMEDAAECSSWLGIFKANFVDMNNACVFLDAIEREIRNRINEQEEEMDGPEPIERKSPLGLYFRKLLIFLRKVSFDETHVLAAQIGEWCGQPVSSRAGMPLAWTHNRERIDTGVEANASAMLSYQAALAAGDYTAAIHGMRRFYDYQLAASARSMHQHSSLNIATFHYNTGGLQSALEAVEIAIRRARTANDSQCLHKCTQLEYRIKVEMESAAWPGFQVPQVKDQRLPPRRLREFQVSNDEIWAIKAAVDLGEPVHVVFRRVYTALSYHYMNVTGDGTPVERPEGLPAPHLSPAVWHGVQAGLWSLIGSNTLAKIHEDMSFTSPDLEDETRMEVVLARADRLCDEGRTDDALVLLLEGSTVDGMASAEYRRWAAGVWSLLSRAAAQEGDSDAQTIINGLRGSNSLLRVGPGAPVREAFDPSAPPTSSAKGIIFAHGEVTSALLRAETLLAAHAPAHLALPDALSALQLAGALALWPLYTRATLAFAETLLAMELPAKAEEAVERVWEQLSPGGVARGALVRAKAYAALAMDATDSQEEETQAQADVLFKQSARYADLTLERAAPLGLRAIHRDARALRSMVAEIAGLPFPRAAAGDMPPPKGSERARRVGEIVRLVGVRVSEGWK